MLKNPRHEAFCQEYHKNGFNAKQAYKTVYKTKNDRTAESNGERLLSNAEVKNRLNELSKKSQLRYGIDMEKLVLRLKDLAYDEDKNASLKAVDMLIKVAGEYAPTKSIQDTNLQHLDKNGEPTDPVNNIPAELLPKPKPENE